MTKRPTHSRISNYLMNIRPNIRVDLCCPETPMFAPFHLNKASDVLCVTLLHIKDKGCGTAEQRGELC